MSGQLRRWSLTAAAALAIGYGSAPAHASYPDQVGFGTRSPALASTGASYETGYEAAYGNPAGLWAGERRLSFGYVHQTPRVNLDGQPYPIETTHGLIIGGSLPLPFGGFLEKRLGLGLGLYLPVGVVNRAHDPFPDVPRAVLLDGRTQVVSILFGAGLRLPAGFSLGGGVIALASLIGSITITQDGTGRITSLSEEQLTIDYAPIVGLRFSRPRFAIGAVLRGESRSTYAIRVATKLGDALPLKLPLLQIAGTAQYDPLQLGLEVSGAPVGSLLLIAQVGWKRWSAFQYPVSKVTATAVDLPAPGFHDTVVPRLAAEYTPYKSDTLSLALRLGYYFEWSPAEPVPPPESAQNLLDATRHAVTGGFGLRLHRHIPLSLDGFVQGQILTEHPRLDGALVNAGLSLSLTL